MTDNEYLSWGDNFVSSNRDYDVRCYARKLITTRSYYECLGIHFGESHTVPRGRRAYFEKAIVDGAWVSNRVCLPCIEQWAHECGGV